jgi:ABC-2 type transport system ATP-binding protein
VLVSSHVLAEVAQTVDQVLIISRGKLVVESSLEHLTARVSGEVRVRSADPARLEAALRAEQLVTGPGAAGALLVQGATSERVGDIAFKAGVAVHELVTEGSSLEDVFLEQTSETAP